MHNLKQYLETEKRKKESHVLKGKVKFSCQYYQSYARFQENQKVFAWLSENRKLKSSPISASGHCVNRS